MAPCRNELFDCKLVVVGFIHLECRVSNVTSHKWRVPVIICLGDGCFRHTKVYPPVMSEFQVHQP